MGGNIAEFEKHDTIEDSDAYYQLWQETLEEIVREKTSSMHTGTTGG